MSFFLRTNFLIFVLITSTPTHAINSIFLWHFGYSFVQKTSLAVGKISFKCLHHTFKKLISWVGRFLITKKLIDEELQKISATVSEGLINYQKKIIELETSENQRFEDHQKFIKENYDQLDQKIVKLKNLVEQKQAEHIKQYDNLGLICKEISGRFSDKVLKEVEQVLGTIEQIANINSNRLREN